MTTNSYQYTGTTVSKRKFNFALGIERNFKAYSEFFGLDSLSDHLYFTGTILAVLSIMLLCWVSNLITGVL